MDIEELKASVEALQAKNRELLGELKVAKAKAKGADIDPEDHAKLQQELEDARAALGKAEKTGKSEIERLTKVLGEKDASLASILVDGGLTEAMAKVGVKTELMGAAKALLKSGAIVKDGVALLGDKPLAEAVAAWATGDEGKHFVTAPANTGGSANGGNANNTAPKGNLGGDKTQRVNAIAARFPELASS